MWKKIIAGALLAVLIGIAFYQAFDKEDEQAAASKTEKATSGVKLGSAAPDFTLASLDGRKVKLSDYRGKKVILNFWATWCPPCKEEMPDFQKFSESAGDDVVILAVNMDPENDVKGFVEERGLTFPILLDKAATGSNTVNHLYEVQNIPTSYFIDEKGIVQRQYLGAMDEKYMKKIVKGI